MAPAVKRTYPPEIRAGALRLAQQGKTTNQIARILGLYPQLVSRWLAVENPVKLEEQRDRQRRLRAKAATACPLCGNPTNGVTCKTCYTTRGPVKHAQHAQVLMLGREGKGDGEIAEAVGVARTTVTRWLKAAGLWNGVPRAR